MKFRLSSEYGELSPVRNMQPHHGIDLAIPENSVLRAISDGVVDRIYDGSDAIGKGLSIKFPDGTRAIYGHMNDVKAKVGEHVNAGDVIGLSGNTGLSTGSHLHFGLKAPDGGWLNPTPLAEHLANISGDNVKEIRPLGDVLLGGVGDTIREQTKEVATEIIFGVLDALLDLVAGVSMIGAAVLIIAKVAGYRDGGRWAGVLLTANILIKYLRG